MHYYTDVLKKYATFEGRARRSEYWMFALFHFIVIAVLAVLAGVTGAKIFAILYGLYFLATLLPVIALTVRRLHDTGRSGGWIFIVLVPFVGGIWLFVLTLLDSQPAPNQYGPSPKAVAGPQQGYPNPYQA
ncbi:DUF805 domain-containing protein [Streptomyces sp. NPDC008150]|uniref:DUF805 domain-containing protein n=1 Tax=Streptomyces sp. NPDC008150 TaxID=3364816 RepID=UPI0036EDEBBE